MPRLLKKLESEMKVLAKNMEFEKAGELKKTIFALQHIQDVALLKHDRSKPNNSFRIEAYDVAHLSGKEVVGVMTVVTDGVSDKDEYRKFKTRSGVGNNDVLNLQEILSRRFKHSEWRLPDLIVVDGGLAQKTVAEKTLKDRGLKIPVVALVKDARHKARQIIGDKVLIVAHKSLIVLANAEAHRFAIAYHKKLRNKEFLK
jgi:excinuclease ABC subunit C